MRKHSLNLLTQILIYLFLIAIPCFTLLFFNHLINTSGTMTNDNMIALCIFVLIIIFWLYLCRTQFIIFKENYKAIAVNHNERKIVLFDRKKQVNIIPFENITHIDIFKGEILRGIVLGQITLLTNSNISYRITISKIDEFYGEVVKDFSVDIKESIFFNAKSNNQINDNTSGNSILNNIKTLIIILLVVVGICARFFKSTHIMNRISSNSLQSKTVSAFDYNDFANNMATQASSLIPEDISAQNKIYIIEKIRENTYFAGETSAKDSNHKFSDEQIMFMSQVIAEWTFHKAVDLTRSGIPTQYWDNIIHEIAFTTYEILKQDVIKQVPHDQLLQAVENNVVKVYNQSIKELEQSGLIDNKTKIKAEHQSNIDAMAK